MTRFEWVCLLFVIAGLWAAESWAQVCDVPEQPEYVFTRFPRHLEPIGKADDGANWQRTSNVGSPYEFPASELAYINKYGLTATIHREKDCAAHEAKVSPDGKLIAYAVSCGTPVGVNVAGVENALWHLKTTTSSLWVWEVGTARRHQITSGHYDRQPEWVSDSCLVFPSDRAGTYAPMAYNGVRYPEKAWQLHKGCLNGWKLEGIRNIGQHQHFAMSPSVTSHGEILYSCWQGQGPDVKPSPNNYWPICAMDFNGANGRVVLGHHWTPEKTVYLKRQAGDWTGGQGLVGRLSLRPAAEIRRGYYATGNYYRLRPGTILGWSHLDVEGANLLKNVQNANGTSSVPGSGLWIPPDIEVLTPFAQEQDLDGPRKNSKGWAGGRSSHPAAGPNGQMLFTWARGYCYDAIAPERATQAAMGGEPTCKREIRLATTLPVVDPFTQSVCVAGCENEWQAFDAQWIAPYKEKYGVDFPTVEPLTGTRCRMEVENARLAELPDSPDYPALVHKISWTPLEFWNKKPTGPGYMSRGLYIDAYVQPDGGVAVDVPCNTPLIFQGIDAADRVLVTDPMPHSLRPGETRTCKGCHAGHSVD